MIIDAVLKKFEKFNYDRKLSPSKEIVKKVNEFEKKISDLSQEKIQSRIQDIKNKIANGARTNSFLPEVFAMTRVAAEKSIGMRHFDVQIIGGYVLHLGAVAEMKTGEGKTLVATLAAVLNALSGSVHVITVNDYLTKRDWTIMSPIYDYLGLSSGYITGEADQSNRKDIYKKDIIYITNSEAVFDYLRDNTQVELDGIVQNGHDFAIFDEADFALIDEARSPIILAGPGTRETAIYDVINNAVLQLDKEDFEIDEKSRHVSLTSDGSFKIEEILKKCGAIAADGNLYDREHAYINHFINQSLHAHHMLQRNVDYIVKDGQVFIIDEFTGRVMEGRRYSDSLHQAVEAKECVQIQKENQTLASISLQNYARLYKKIAGMTGTAATEAKELRDIYNLDVYVIPTNMPLIRKDYDDDVYNTAAEKERAILELIEERHKKGQPLLVGTISIEKSEKLSQSLQKKGIKHNVLNAKHHEKEAQIIAQAGRLGAVTIATNMAGRGTDIKLGGNLQMILDDFVTKFQCFPGSDKYEQKKREIEQQIIEDEKQILEIGGLYVIGTERHESRRIDNQLRGRSGRQGNSGESKFFISLDDDLMRIFGSNRIQGILSRLGLKEGEVINHPLINRSIEKAQKKLENNHYEARKSLIKFDNIVSTQREIIFKKRLEIIDKNSFDEEFRQLSQKVFNKVWENFLEEQIFEKLHKNLLEIFGIKIEESVLQDQDQETLQNNLNNLILEKLQAKDKLYLHIERSNIKKRIYLLSIDSAWRENLQNVEYIKRGIHLRSIAQKDPLMEFQREVFEVFSDMLIDVEHNILKYYFNLG